MSRWPIKALSDVLELSRERVEPKEHGSTSFNYIGLESIEGHTGRLLPYQPTTGSEIKSTKNVFHPGDILYGKLRPYLNKVHIADKGGICSTDIYVLRPRKACVNPSFVANYLRSPYVLSKVSNAMEGANLPRIGKAALLSIPIPVPPLAEQEWIVKLLDEADELRKLRAQADRRTADLIPALFHEMFGDPEANSKGWPVKNIERVCTRVTDGTHDTPAYVSQGIPLVTSKNLREGVIDFSNVQYISRADHNNIIKRSYAQGGDILLAMIGTIGNAAVVPKDIEISIKNVALFKPDTRFTTTEYLHAFLCDKDFIGRLRASAKGVTQKFVGLSSLRSISLPIPPLALQQQFAQRVEEIRAMETEQAASRQWLDNLFQSTLHRAFDGRI